MQHVKFLTLVVLKYPLTFNKPKPLCRQWYTHHKSLPHPNHTCTCGMNALPSPACLFAIDPDTYKQLILSYRTIHTWSGIGRREGNASNESSPESILVNVSLRGVTYLMSSRGDRKYHEAYTLPRSRYTIRRSLRFRRHNRPHQTTPRHTTPCHIPPHSQNVST